MNYEGIDREAIIQRDIRTIVNYRMKKDKTYQNVTNGLGITMLILFAIAFLYLAFNNGFSKNADMPLPVFIILAICVAIMITIAIYSFTIESRFKKAVKKEYGL